MESQWQLAQISHPERYWYIYGKTISESDGTREEALFKYEKTPCLAIDMPAEG